jgi:hypothetical protein
LNSQKQILSQDVIDAVAGKQQDVIDAVAEKQQEVLDVKFQDITYHMDNSDKSVDWEEHAQIDFLKAVNEMKNLNWNYENNYITFVNNKTKECVQFLRKGENDWYAEVPINDGVQWDGYAWSCDTTSKPVIDMLRLYFEEVQWFGMLSWKMRRFKH